MRIAIIAHDSRKELMAQFCTAYLRILSENELVATGVTGKITFDENGDANKDTAYIKTMSDGKFKFLGTQKTDGTFTAA